MRPRSKTKMKRTSEVRLQLSKEAMGDLQALLQDGWNVSLDDMLKAPRTRGYASVVAGALRMAADAHAQMICDRINGPKT